MPFFHRKIVSFLWQVYRLYQCYFRLLANNLDLNTGGEVSRNLQDAQIVSRLDKSKRQYLVKIIRSEKRLGVKFWPRMCKKSLRSWQWHNFRWRGNRYFIWWRW